MTLRLQSCDFATCFHPLDMKCLGRNYHRGHFLPRTFPSSDFSKPGSSPLALHLLSLRPRPSPKFPSLCPLACTSDYTRPLSIHTTYCFSLSGMEVPALSCCFKAPSPEFYSSGPGNWYPVLLSWGGRGMPQHKIFRLLPCSSLPVGLVGCSA